MLNQLRTTLLSKSNDGKLFQMKEYIEHVQFCIVDENKMISIGGVGEQIACIGNMCYLTNTYLNFPKSLQRIYFFKEYLNRFSYLNDTYTFIDRSVGCTDNEFVEFLETKKNPMIDGYDSQYLDILEHPYVEKDVDEVLEQYATKFVVSLAVANIFLTECSEDVIEDTVLNVDVKNKQLTIKSDISSIPEIQKICFYASLPKATMLKACLTWEYLIKNRSDILGKLDILVDTPEVCVLRISNMYMTFDSDLEESVEEQGDYGKLLYYHYETKRFIGNPNPAYKTFQENYGAMVELQLAHDNN